MKKAIVLLFLVFSYTICNSQELIVNKKFYKITIFQWEKDSFGNDDKKLIVIDENGNVSYNNKSGYAKLDIVLMESFFSWFIQKQNLIKKEANDDPPAAASIPKNGEKNLHISLVEIKDFIAEKDYANPSQYTWRGINVIDLTDVFNGMQQEEMIKLEKLLK